jgi:cytochrome c
VSDEVDGDSKYGEININEVLLEIEYLPITKEEELNEAAIKEKIKIAGKAPEPAGLSLLKKSTCFGCHADKSKHSGPSFSEIAGRYENSQANIAALAGNISGGSTGVWGSMVMPSHPDLTVLETQQIAEYILTQGARKNSWVLPGLEGTFRITKKPENSVKGFYILTASYTSTSKIRGQHSVILGIQ